MAEHKITPVPKEVKSASGAIDHYADQRTAEPVKTASPTSDSVQIPPSLHSAAAMTTRGATTNPANGKAEPFRRPGGM